MPDPLRPGFTQNDRRSLGFNLLHAVGDSGIPRGTRNLRRDQVDTLLGSLLSEGFSLRDEEDRRFRGESSFLTGEFNRANEDFASQEERLDRLFRSRAADQIGAEARSGLRNVRSLIGSRGLNPNSGLAASLAADVASRQQGQLISARRDIALDSARRRTQERARRLTSAFGLSEFRNQSPSMLGLDAIGATLGVQRAREQEANAKSAAKKSRGDALLGGAIQGGLGLIGSFL